MYLGSLASIVGSGFASYNWRFLKHRESTWCIRFISDFLPHVGFAKIFRVKSFYWTSRFSEHDTIKIKDEYGFRSSRSL